MGFCLRTHHLTKRYGEKAVVHDLNLNIRIGDIYGFLGQNGAGKTTTLRMLMGLIRPSAGEIELFGAGLNGGRAMALERIGAIIEYPGFYLNLSATENLEIHRRLMGMGNKKCIDEVLITVGLLDAKHQKVKNYSLGMKQRLGIARALLHHPEFLILDEPTNGLDPVGIKEIRLLFLDLARQRGITFLISSHLLSEIEQVATRIGIIHQGRLLEEIDYETLQEKTRHYLEIKVDDEQRAAYVLEQKLGVTDYLVAGPGILRLYERLDKSAMVNSTLASHGIGVKESVLSGKAWKIIFSKSPEVLGLFSVIYTEMMKLKNTKILWMVLIGALPANLVSLLALLPKVSPAGAPVGINLQDMFYRQGQVITILGPALFALMTAYIIAREYQERTITINQLFSYPVSRVGFLAGKLSAVFLLIAITTALSCVTVLVIGSMLFLKHQINVDVIWLGMRMNLMIVVLSFGTIPVAAALSMVGKSVIPMTVLGVFVTVITVIGEAGHGLSGILFPWLVPYWPVRQLAQGIAQNSSPNPYAPPALVILALTFFVSLIFCIVYYVRADVHSGS